MNKKISTLFTAGLLIAGSLFSSAWAADLIPLQDAKSGDTYLLKATQRSTDGNNWVGQQGDYYVGINDDGKVCLTTDKTTLWTISYSDAGTVASRVYTFNSNKGPLNVTYTVTEEGKQVEKKYEGGYTATKINGNTGPASAIDFTVDNALYRFSHNSSNTLFGHTGSPANSIVWSAFQLEATPETTVDEELNGLYNGKGFRLTAAGEDEEVDGDLLAENTVIAVSVPEDYDLSELDVHGYQLIIPAGTYFFTERVWKDGLEEDEIANIMDKKDVYKYINWPKSTIVYVQPKNSVETTVKDRANGQGFQLAQALVSDFVYEKNESAPAVGDLSIWNACFEVKESADKYAIRVKKFYYQGSKDDTDDKDAKLAEDVDLDLLTIDGDASVSYLATVVAQDEKAGYNYAFVMSDSAIKDAVEMLKTTEEAAVYSIKFVAGNQNQSALVGKYLTLGSKDNGGVLRWIAKDNELSNTDFPIFQYTITAVSKEKNSDKKYTIITFTNRETGHHFDVQLYPETAAGEDCYSMAFANGTKFGDNNQVLPVSVKRNGYATEEGGLVTINSDVIVEIKAVEVDQYAGFAQIDDKAIRTIRFARDVNQTSNVWYTGVLPKEDVPEFTLTEDTKQGYFVEEAYDAAQFQINVVESTNKEPNPSTIARTCVYWNENTKSVDHVSKGDVLAAYRYTLQYVTDGAAQKDVYFSEADGDPSLAVKAQEYYIKENVDGSVNLIRVDNNVFVKVGSTIHVAPEDAKEALNVVAIDEGEYVNYARWVNDSRQDIYDYNVNDMDLNMYLDDEIPVVSWENEGHVTLQNNNGNYISFNDANEGILVSDAGEAYFLYMTDTEAVVPSFYITKGFGSDTERMFLFNPIDSVNYQVNMNYDPKYMLASKKVKAIFKAGSINEDRDQMTITDSKGEPRVIEATANGDGIWAGLNRFKFQIVKVDGEDSYYIRQLPENVVGLEEDDTKTRYLASLNDELFLTTDKAEAMKVLVETTEGPTANETIADEAEGVEVIAGNGAVTIQGAAGKTVVITNILGKAIANTTLTSDNQTINVPAGIVVVTVDGEAVKAIVK